MNPDFLGLFGFQFLDLFDLIINLFEVIAELRGQLASDFTKKHLILGDLGL